MLTAEWLNHILNLHSKPLLPKKKKHADSQNPDDSVGEISVQIDLSTDSSTGEHKVTVKGK